MKIAVIGAGSVIFNDEGIGVYAQKYLKKNYNFDKNITFVDGGVLGFKLMTYYLEFDKVIILDTITIKNDEAGSVYNLPAQELMGLGSYKQTAHEVEIVEMLEICSLLENMADVNIIGIIPKNILSVKAGLSNTLKKNFNNFINEALVQLNSFDIKYTKKEKYISLDRIIHSYSYPKAQRNLKGLV